MNILFNWIPAFAGTTNKTGTTAMDGGSANYAGAVICLPPWMVGVQIMQEQLFACRHGWWECKLRRSSYLPVAMDGGSANNAGAVICLSPWMAEVQIQKVTGLSFDKHAKLSGQLQGNEQLRSKLRGITGELFFISQQAAGN